MGAETPATIVEAPAPEIVGLQPSALVDHMARVDWSVLNIPGETGGSFPVYIFFFLFAYSFLFLFPFPFPFQYHNLLNSLLLQLVPVATLLSLLVSHFRILM